MIATGAMKPDCFPLFRVVSVVSMKMDDMTRWEKYGNDKKREILIDPSTLVYGKEAKKSLTIRFKPSR